MNPLVAIRPLDQSIWLDFIRRKILIDGTLQQLITDDHLRGVTSNPAIFEKAIGGSDDYDTAIRALALQGKSTNDIYEALAVADVQAACDLFRPLYDDAANAGDGYVSLEVSPKLVNDTAGTIAEGLRLWQAVGRPNVMIKVPATLEGLPAIRRLISEGVNVNVTLIFSVERYKAVAEAFLAGLEDRLQAGQPVKRIDSVASFFLSRIDVLIDPQLEKLVAAGGAQAAIAGPLVGQVAVASAKQAYQVYKQIFTGPRWEALKAQGAESQRLLWASTGNKNPKYDDLKYVDGLIGPHTVNTIPLETLNLFREKGRPAVRLEDGLDQVHAVLAALPTVGLDLETLAHELEVDGAKKFTEPFGKLMAALDAKRTAALAETTAPATLQLGPYQAAVDAKAQEFAAQRFTEGFWQADAALWTDDAQAQQSIRDFTGWLRVAETLEAAVPALETFVNEVKMAGFQHVLVMGMGGSTMAPIVFQQAFAQGAGGLPISVLDTTDPGTVRHFEQTLPLADTLFIVASKSGTTAEPLAFGDYFYDKVKALKGDRAGENFVAITDPGSKFIATANALGYRHVFLNFEAVGGRFSALTYFGLVPAALYGLNVGEILARAIRMMRACGAYGPVDHNPGLALGTALGVLATQGRDKLTLVTPPALSSLGLWLEQLTAESTGKHGKGILPVAGEPVGAPAVYGHDRVFVYVGYESEEDAENKAKLQALEAAGHPVITVLLEEALDLGQEFFRWEMAIAVVGAVLRINPFDQPNVQESKTATDRLMKVVADEGHLPAQEKALAADGIAYYGVPQAPDAAHLLAAFFGQAKAGDYVSIQAYLTESPELNAAFDQLRTALMQRLHTATTFGYGPRFLHSTGQYHKGGPNTGLLLQLTADHAQDLPLPGRSYTFGTLESAQAQGDLEALQKYERRALHVHFGTDVLQGLRTVHAALDATKA